PATVLAEYSVTGEDGTWHAAFAGGDVFAHYSYDGGRTWTDKVRIVGKSLEFKPASLHFTKWTDFRNFMLQGGEPLFYELAQGTYLLDEDDGFIPGSYIVTHRQLTDFQKFDEDGCSSIDAPIDDKYLTAGGGHLWNSQGLDKPWLDMGRIEGAAGTDGVSFVLSPATVIFEQDEKTLKIDTRRFAAHVIGMSGARMLSAGRDYKIARVDGAHCNAVANGDRILIESIGKDAEGRYYSSGSVTVTIKGVGSQEIALTLNWAANLLGTWKQTVKNDVMQAVSEKTVTY
ncbi:hypothetical protein, partial [Prevotella sp. OH937_COT-195]|uniref:hypothetical protein n=1 Tax=Prevotella sp. OH937_COT-195 TaxID=2491051 RepID=UPI0013154777